MATPHISAEPGDFAPDVLMPGDPKRAQRIAETVLEGARLVSDVRGIVGYTGSFDGRPVSVLASGMGIPSMSIYATELYRFYGVERIIRIGTAGGMAPHLQVGDVVIANIAHTDSSIIGNKIPQIHFSAGATFSLTAAAAEAAGVSRARAKAPRTDDGNTSGRRRRRHNGSVYVGAVISSDIFYSDRPLTNELLVAHGTLAVEMEAAGLYAVAAQEGKEALAICTISDLLFREEALSSAEREQLFDKAVALGLAAFANA